MVDKKTVIIFVLFALFVFAGFGWLRADLAPTRDLSNVYDATDIFHGYESYLDKDIRLAPMETESMAPAINPSDTVLWVEIDNTDELGVGNIIIFKHPTRPVDNVAHRIIEVGIGDREGQFKTKGDNVQITEWVPDQNIHGLVIGVIYA